MLDLCLDCALINRNRALKITNYLDVDTVFFLVALDVRILADWVVEVDCSLRWGAGMYSDSSIMLNLSDVCFAVL